MKFKKSLFVIPMSAALLLPTTGLANAATSTSQPSVTTQGAELRSTLDHLFSEHAYLAITAMRKGAEGAKDFQASANELSKNTDDLTKAISSVYGDAAGQKFKKMWKAHISYFVDYVKATGAKDEAGKKKALDNLANYRQDFSKFMSSATGGRVPADAIVKNLQTHVNQLIGAFDAYVNGDYNKAYMLEREAMHHMYMVSEAFSKAIVAQFPKKFNNTKAVTPASDLRSNLNYLLSEHAGLAVTAMQNGLDGSKDFKASAMALSNNTDDLTKAIGSVYGQDAANKFKKMWSGHVSDFVAYVQATASNDDSKKKAAKDKLDAYSKDFADFISGATNGKLKASDLTQGLQTHVDQLLGAFNSYADKDYASAYKQIDDAYGHMFMTSKGLSGAIVNQYPDKFMMKNMPGDMPKTGLGGSQQNDYFEWFLLALVAMAAGTALYAQQRSSKEQ